MNYLPEYWDDVERVIPFIPNVEKLNGKRILITGGTGMIGSAVIDVLAYLNHHKSAGIQIILAGRNREKIDSRFAGVLDKQEYTFVPFDATSPQTVEAEAEYMIHGAGNANPAVYSREPAETLLGNIIGLRTMLDVARANKGSRLLYISSSEVYGNRLNGSAEPYREDEYGYVDILNPRACYPNGKRTAETLCACYHQEYGIDPVIVRPGHIYGPSITRADTRASAMFTRDVHDGHDIVMKSAGDQLRSYCYTLDCASALLTVLINGQSCNAYNISNRHSIVSIRDMAEALAEAGGVNVVFENPSDIEKKSYNLMSNSGLDSQKLESLGWEAVFDLENGVKRTVKYYN